VDFTEDAWYNDPRGFPTMKEVVMGLWELVCEKIDGLMKNASIEEKKAVKENYRWAFMFMLISIDYDAIDTDLTTEDF